MASNDKGELTYKEMRAVAQEIFAIERKQRKMRTAALVVSGLLLGTIAFLLCMVLIYGLVSETEVKDDHNQLALVKKGSNQVVATTESVEDLDGADLVDYDRSGKDANGTADGNWLLSESQIAMIRTISWREADVMNVHHIAGITRYDGQDARVEMTTKAGHEIVVWDSDGVDNFNVKLKRWNPDNNAFDPEVEVNAEGDFDNDPNGRGRVVVSLRRPTLDKSGSGAVSTPDYF
jgi:hypothetical protein